MDMDFNSWYSWTLTHNNYVYRGMNEAYKATQVLVAACVRENYSRTEFIIGEFAVSTLSIRYHVSYHPKAFFFPSGISNGGLSECYLLTWLLWVPAELTLHRQLFK